MPQPAVVMRLPRPHCDTEAMARLARVVIPGLAHHVTQRGNGRQRVFFSSADYALYLRLLRESCVASRVTCLAYCLMPNHFHFLIRIKSENELIEYFKSKNISNANLEGLKKPSRFTS